MAVPPWRGSPALPRPKVPPLVGADQRRPPAVEIAEGVSSNRNGGEALSATWSGSSDLLRGMRTSVPPTDAGGNGASLSRDGGLTLYLRALQRALGSVPSFDPLLARTEEMDDSVSAKGGVMTKLASVL